MPEEMTFEQALKSLEEAVAQLEKGQMPLDESLAAFETGIELTRRAQKALGEAEQKVKLLLAEEGEPVLADMPTNDGG